MGYRGKDPNGGDEVATRGPPKKRRRTVPKTEKGYKKDFDPPPSELLTRLPSLKKCRPFKQMVAQWWLEKNPEFRVIERGADWLEGFCHRLNSEELHPADWDHLEELWAWHKQQKELMGEDQTPAT